MSIERELGQINEAIVGLKNGQAEHREALKVLDAKLDRHLAGYAALNFKVGKLAGTVALTVSLLLAGVKEALARLWSP